MYVWTRGGRTAVSISYPHFAVAVHAITLSGCCRPRGIVGTLRVVLLVLDVDCCAKPRIRGETACRVALQL